MDIAWEDLTIAVNGKPIIRRMSGRARAGRMIAVMGPTGSGKTTLLTNLAARGEGTYDIGGEVRYGGQEWSKALKRRLGFVEQEDLVAAELTVRQNLNVAAQLRLPQHRLAPSGEEADPGWLVMNRKLERVEEVIRMLHMEKCADTVVGSAGARGVSGGEKKRLCIGMELLTEPKFLFFDEPTSGLDSSHALLVAKCMRDLCRSGVTVISSIHQPSSQIFELFDDLLLLDEGNVAYFGPTADSVSFFSSVGFDCPTSWNPADFFMDLLVLEEKQAALREKLGYVASRPGKQHAQANADAATTAARNAMSVTVELASSGSVPVRLSAGRARVRDAKAAMWSAAGFAPVQIVLCDSAEGHTPLDDGELLEDGQTLWLDDVKFSAARLCADQHKEGDGPGLLPAAVSNAVADRYTAPFSMQLRVLTERIFVVQAEQQWSWMNFSLYTLLASSTGMCWWRTGYEEKHIFTRMSLVFWFIGTYVALCDT
jgi:ABC-type multidrug transport system ATPase subunit